MPVKKKNDIRAYEVKGRSFCLSSLFTHSLNYVVMKLRLKSIKDWASSTKATLASEIRTLISKL